MTQTTFAPTMPDMNDLSVAALCGMAIQLHHQADAILDELDDLVASDAAAVEAAATARPMWSAIAALSTCAAGQQAHTADDLRAKASLAMLWGRNGDPGDEGVELLLSLARDVAAGVA